MNIKKFIKSIILRILGSVISSVVIYGLFFYSMKYYFKREHHVKLEPNTFLILDLQGEVVENIHKSFLTVLLEKNEKRTHESKILFWDLLTKINSATSDKNIIGIVINLGHLNIGWAQIEELKKSILNFKKSGKKVVAYCRNCSQKNYLLLTDADYVFMHPDTEFFIHGISSSAYLFYKEALDKLEINVNVFKAGEYKSAVEPYTNKKMSDLSRSQLLCVLNDIDTFFKSELSRRSNNNPEKLKNIIDNVKVDCPYEGLRYGFVNQVGTYNDLLTYLYNDLYLGKVAIQFCLDFLYEPKEKKYSKNSKHIKILALEGVIIEGISSSGYIGSVTTCDIIDDIKHDKDIDFVIVRINSIGGSSYASELIFDALSILAKIKPTSISMSNVAASGGYYIASASNKIFANHTTITGSIGGFGISFDVSKAMSKLGLTTDMVKINDNSDLFNNPGGNLSDFERSKLQKSLDYVYDKFLSRVSNSRKITKDKLAKDIASGRIWSGLSAKSIGLTDGVAGIEDVIDYACSILNTNRENTKISFFYDPVSFANSEMDINVFSKMEYSTYNKIFQNAERLLTIFSKLSNKNLLLMHDYIVIE